MIAAWSKGKLTIRYVSNSTGEIGSREVDADIFNGLAVHEALGVTTTDNKAVISVSHVATGLKVSPTFFDDRKAAVNAAVALAALPVLWDEQQPVSQQDRKFLRAAIEAICALCGGFEIDSAMDKPGGHA